MKKFILTVLLVLALCNLVQGIAIKNGDTSVITYFVLRDKTAGTVDTGVTIANIDCYHVEEGAVISGKTDLAAHAAGDDAWDATPQGYHMGYGVYRVDWPNAAFDGGVGKTVQLIVIDGDGGAFTEIVEVELSPPIDVITVAGTAQTANDNGADINLILTDTAAQDTSTEIRTLMTGSDTTVATQAKQDTIDNYVDTEVAKILADVNNIVTDTNAMDTSGELRILLTDYDLALATDANQTTIISDVNSIWLNTNAIETDTNAIETDTNDIQEDWSTTIEYIADIWLN